MAAGFLVSSVLAVVLLCLFFGIHSRRDILAYRCMRAEHFHPVWKDLALRRIRKGDDLAEVVKRHPPVRLEECGPYTALLYHKGVVSFNCLQIIATKDVLIGARADSCCWNHVFFESPEHEPALREAWSRYYDQMGMEGYALHIHRAIEAGGDVFAARLVERREITETYTPKYSQEALAQYEKIYGRDALMAMEASASVYTRPELTVEVSNVLYGDLKPGTTLTFFGDECEHAMRTEPQVVFLHVEDSRIIFPHTEGGELYHAVPARALEWYQS
ncbi:MAG: hypothetical protein ABFE01_11565, partial [Phycisphaerales bacterium]